MKQGFWSGIYEWIDAMQHAGSWWLYAVMGVLLAGLLWWFAWAWKTLRREAGL